MELNTLFRMTHPALFITARYTEGEVMTGGPQVLAMTHASATRGMHEVLHQTTEHCSFIEPIHPNEPVSSLTYVHDVNEVSYGLEELKLSTLGVKNIDVSRELANVSLPKKLFQDGIKPSEYNDICRDHAPQLMGKIVASSTRKILRQQAPSDYHVFLL